MSHPDPIPTPTSAKPREIGYVADRLAAQFDFSATFVGDSCAVGSPYRESPGQIRRVLGNCDRRGKPRPVYDVMWRLDCRDWQVASEGGSP